MVLLLSSCRTNELCMKVWSVFSQQVRYRNRPNLKRPLPVHYNKARMLAVCEPVYPFPPRNCELEAVTVTKKENAIEDNPYATFLAGQLRRDLTNHPLVCIFHSNNYTQHELIDIRGSLYDMKFHMKFQEVVNATVVKMSLVGTRWSPLIQLAQPRTTFGFCADNNLPKLMKALKKMPQFILLAVVSHGRILHKGAIEELVKIGDITNVRAQLCSTLSSQSVNLSQNLTANINALSHNLSVYAKNDDTSSSSSSDSDGDSSSSSDSDKD